MKAPDDPSYYDDGPVDVAYKPLILVVAAFILLAVWWYIIL